jgi:hypothetical protein
MAGPTPTGNILMIDGHGATGATQQTFDFRRSQGTRVNLYSYVNEGTGTRVAPSEYLMAASVGGQIPKGSTSVSSSDVSGTRARNWVLHARDLKQEEDGRWVLEWNYEFPSEWGADMIPLQSCQGPDVEVLCCYNGADPRSSTRVWLSLQAEGPDEPMVSVWLSTVLAHFNTRPYDVLWMASRGGD